ncbi:hypothetical protein COOONC_14954 [Cooperia oncophora]
MPNESDFERDYIQESGNHAAHHDQRSTVSRSHSAGGSERQGASKVNRNINRFSNFVKSGMEAYILGESRMNGQPGEKHEVIISGPLVQWRPIQQYYTCTVDKPKKETKLKGLKSFIAYSLTSTLSRIQVSRRLKHLIVPLSTLEQIHHELIRLCPRSKYQDAMRTISSTTENIFYNCG